MLFYILRRRIRNFLIALYFDNEYIFSLLDKQIRAELAALGFVSLLPCIFN